MKKKSVLFVCFGNICRSPLAETIFTNMLKENNMLDECTCDSAGTSDAHSGEYPDDRVQKVLMSRNLKSWHQSRILQPEDFKLFQFILVMDDYNLEEINRLFVLSKEEKSKIFKLGFFASKHILTGSNIMDPYYGTIKDFTNLLNVIEDSCNGFFFKHFSKKIISKE